MTEDDDLQSLVLVTGHLDKYGRALKVLDIVQTSLEVESIFQS